MTLKILAQRAGIINAFQFRSGPGKAGSLLCQCGQQRPAGNGKSNRRTQAGSADLGKRDVLIFCRSLEASEKAMRKSLRICFCFPMRTLRKFHAQARGSNHVLMTRADSYHTQSPHAPCAGALGLKRGAKTH